MNPERDLARHRQRRSRTDRRWRPASARRAEDSAAHLFHLFGRSELLPRLDATTGRRRHGSTPVGTHLSVARRRSRTSSSAAILCATTSRSGTCLTPPAGKSTLSQRQTRTTAGRLQLVCDFEEFGSDTELNRVLKAAALGSRRERRYVGLDPASRNQARAHGWKRSGRCSPPTSAPRSTGARRTTAMRLRSRGPCWRTFGARLSTAKSLCGRFLIRTPELVEAGVRNELRERLGRQVEHPEGDDPLAGCEHDGCSRPADSATETPSAT